MDVERDSREQIEDEGEQDIFQVVDFNPEALSGGNSDGSPPLCVWLKRRMVDQLLPSENEKSAERRKAVGEMEEEILEREMRKCPLPIFVEKSKTQNEEKLRSLRKRHSPSKLVHSYQTRTNPKPSETVSSRDFVNSESIGSDSQNSTSGIESAGSSGSSDNETSDTDYSEYAGPSTSTATRRVRRTRLRVKHGEAEEVSDHSELEEEEEEEEEKDGRKRTGRSPQRRVTTGRPRKLLRRRVISCTL